MIYIALCMSQITAQIRTVAMFINYHYSCLVLHRICIYVNGLFLCHILLSYLHFSISCRQARLCILVATLLLFSIPQKLSRKICVFLQYLFVCRVSERHCVPKSLLFSKEGSFGISAARNSKVRKKEYDNHTNFRWHDNVISLT